VEVFQHRFYKNLDDSVTCSDMADSDIVVCFELPCNSQQSQNYKRSPEDPFIVPVYLGEETQAKPMTYGRGSPSYFGYPFVAVIDQETATDQDKIYNAVVERLEQWTKNSPQLYKWENDSPSSSNSIMEEVPIPINSFLPMDTVTEFKENGEVVMLHEAPQEGDITDEKDFVVQEVDTLSQAAELRKLGPKPDIFTLRLNNTISPFASGFQNQNRYESWERRGQTALPNKEGISSRGPLLRDGDIFVCEFDEHMKDFFFSDLPVTDVNLWNAIQEFLHPEYVESKKTESARSNKGITLQDCLDEFTKEEKLGEDDLWYCPRCKKHQQATKRFDLWKLPDILVVHLKRFSNSRILRDKIDTFVDFPIEGLDLENMVGERITAKTLMGLGEDPAALGLGDVNEPLIYDLYAVDEHLGGLGGGHYRAFALNHPNNKWYHFDDSYVSECQAKAAIVSSISRSGKCHHSIFSCRIRTRIFCSTNVGLADL
jgi:ubiquitin carboxyl-terminal hydrolase 4/11